MDRTVGGISESFEDKRVVRFLGREEKSPNG